MARLAKRRALDDQDDHVSAPQGSHHMLIPVDRESSHESSPAASFSSDKENRASNARRTADKGKAPLEQQEKSNKRRKLGGALEPSQPRFERVREGVDNKAYYDPDQPMAQRRAVRKSFRDLAKELSDSRTDYLAPTSDGIKTTVERANRLFVNVKQTSDATLDSRLLVTAGDLTARRAIQNKLGGVTVGIDLDEFVGKCISFMRRGPNEREITELGLSQNTRLQRRQGGDFDISDAEEGQDEGDAYDWEWLGRKACYPYNKRPAVPGFLLGPLSVQKKARKITQRTQRQQRRDPADAVRPDEIKPGDIEKAENANLTTLCRKIYDILCSYQVPRSNAADADIEALGENVTEEEAFDILERHGLRNNTGVCFYQFAFNPESFGQTVENLFYISFLIRDGLAGLMEDTNGLLTLHPTAPSTPAQIREQNIVKRQAVFHVDFQTWRDIVEEFGIEECIIPHRQSDQGRQQMGTKGWYG